MHDITHPYNMVEVGNYDTYPTQTTSYDGCWGVYPYLPSGLILASEGKRGTFLPKVWDSLETPEKFLNGLKVKARLPRDYWSADVQVHRYVTETFRGRIGKT